MPAARSIAQRPLTQPSAVIGVAALCYTYANRRLALGLGERNQQMSLVLGGLLLVLGVIIAAALAVLVTRWALRL